MPKPRKITLPEGVIWHGDAIEVMRSLPAKSVDLVCGSPPYENSRLYLENGEKSHATVLDGQDWVDWMVQVFEESLRVCKGLVAYVVGHGKQEDFKWTATPALLIADLHRKGICLRNPLWYKRVGICGSGGDDWMRKDLEFIICATNGGKLPWSDNTACGHPPKWGPGGEMSNRTQSGKRANKKDGTPGERCGHHTFRGPDGERKVTKYTSPDLANPGDIIDCNEDISTSREMKVRGSYRKGEGGRYITATFKDGRQEKQYYVPPEKANPGDVIDCQVGGGKLGSNIAHENEAAFPSKIPWFLIKSFCPPGGVVLDPFGGSGTTLSEAVKSGRKFISCDVRLSQVKLMLRRYKQALRQRGLIDL